MKLLFVTILFAVSLTSQVSGHGSLLDPPNRSSMWRYGFDNPINWDDNQLYCGAVHQDEAVSKCGICGDPLSQPTPRENEYGGKYGSSGIIVKSYTPGSIVPVFVKLTANHYGYFKFTICNMDVSDETESCFVIVPLENGENEYEVPRTGAGNFTYNLRLPQELTCKHCVLRWQYRGGNSWGNCGDGTSAQGCGKQETFRACADISVGDGYTNVFSDILDMEINNSIEEFKIQMLHLKNMIREYKTKQQLYHLHKNKHMLQDIKNDIDKLINDIEE